MNYLKADRTLQCAPTSLKRFYFILKASLVFILFLTDLPESHPPAADAAESRVNCSIHDGPCFRRLPGLDIKLDVSPKPVRAMQKLEFRVTLSGEEPERAPYIDLGMPGMNMGPNRVVLEKISRALYEGVGVIVRCPSGSRTWRATVTVPGRGEAEFIFDVVY